MSDLLFPSHTVTTSRVVNLSLDVALRTIQDFPEMIRLDARVVGFEASTTNPNLYLVKVKKDCLGFSFNTSHTIKFVMVVNGLDVAWGTGFGTTFATSWRAKWTEGKTEITETNTVKAFFLRLPFVTSDLRKSHDHFLDALAARLEG
ncbi:hypothetical protein NEOLEDRAFT_1173868 [Neolentinus lepideus HHB14362 ss-1]|uniref:Uncharacterized protein n=1 Tax=Neolentinus lepideus HHB14362 ss-1 TaxID=1314782 RepID=A0A165VZP2_9AGAM|nr:hypothetical protein NEOLEDRAFT_1173868 [Neolentinus lepideus HHB14362 ss-1]